ncbi:MAG TPA: GAF domain-containing protein [Chloroflexi bacterium]|nr:GAF domain-containing protein [Chloroflexota bacterium]
MNKIEELEQQLQIVQMESQMQARALYQFCRDLSTAQSDDDLIQVLAWPTIETEAATVNLIYVDSDDAGGLERIRVIANWHREDEDIFPLGSRYQLSEIPLSQLLLADPDTPLLISDVEKDDRLNDESRAWLLQKNVYALASIPLTLPGHWIGIVLLTWCQPHNFSEQEEIVYNGLVGVVTPVVNGRRLVAEAQKRMAELQALNELGRTLRGRLDVPAILEETYYQASRLMQATDFYIALYEPDTNEIVLLIDVIEGHVTKPYARWKARRGFAEYVIQHREPVIAQDTYARWADSRDVNVHKRTELNELGVRIPRSVMGVPLIAGEEVLGMIAVRDYENPKAYTQHDLDLLTVIANQVAIALQNARMFDNLEQMVKERTAELEREIAERERVEAERARLQEEIIKAQRLAIQELSTPVIPIMDRIIVMPLIGSIDTLRARDITRNLLAGITRHRAKVVILDITGVPIVDSGVADHLNKTIQAARLKGARTIVTGISDAVAETIVDLGIDWSNVETLSDLQTGLLSALSSMGFKLGRMA